MLVAGRGGGDLGKFFLLSLLSSMVERSANPRKAKSWETPIDFFFSAASYRTSQERSLIASLRLRDETESHNRVVDDAVAAMKKTYAASLYNDPDAVLDDLREAVTTLEAAERTARRVLGGAHPTTAQFEEALQDARVALRLRTK